MRLIKKYGVWIALLLTLLTTKWVSQQETEDEVEVVTKNSQPSLNHEIGLHPTRARNTKNKQENQPAQLISNNFVQRKLDNQVTSNIFSILTVNNNLLATETTVAQPLTNPFSYAGKIIEEGATVVFLIDGEKSHAVKSGDVIEDTWKVKSIKPPIMIIRNIPLKVDLKMEIGANS